MSKGHAGEEDEEVVEEDIPSTLPGPYRHVSLPRTRTDKPCQLASGTMARWSFLPCLPVYRALLSSPVDLSPCRDPSRALASLQGCAITLQAVPSSITPLWFRRCSLVKPSVAFPLVLALPCPVLVLVSFSCLFFRFCSFPRLGCEMCVVGPASVGR